MGGISRCLVLGYISENKLIQSSVIFHCGADGSKGKQDCPGDKPYREENADDHSKKANKEVGIEAVGILNRMEVGSKDGPGPSKEVGS